MTRQLTPALISDWSSWVGRVVITVCRCGISQQSLYYSCKYYSVTCKICCSHIRSLTHRSIKPSYLIKHFRTGAGVCLRCIMGYIYRLKSEFLYIFGNIILSLRVLQDSVWILMRSIENVCHILSQHTLFCSLNCTQLWNIIAI